MFKNNLNSTIRKYKIKISSAIKKIFAISKNIISVNLIPQIQNKKCKIKILSEKIIQNFKNLQIPEIKFIKGRFIEFEITKPKFSGIRLLKFKITKTKIFAFVLFILTLGFFINLLFHFKEKEVDAVGVEPIQLRKRVQITNTTPNTWGITSVTNPPGNWGGLYGQGEIYGVEGWATGNGYGIYGYSGASSGNGAGTFGYSPNSYGVYGQSDNQAGVYGYNTSGNTWGIVGYAPNYGVKGQGNLYGVFGENPSSNYYGVYGRSGGIDNTVYGNSGIGVFGGGPNYGIAGQSPNVGVEGFATGNGYGVIGNSQAASGTGYAGVYGYSPNSWGVRGESANNHGVYGQSGATGYAGVFGAGYYGIYGVGNITGVYAYSPNAGGWGVYGYGVYNGIYGFGNNVGTFGDSDYGVGIYGRANSGWGVYGTCNSGYGGSYAGYFDGRVYARSFQTIPTDLAEYIKVDDPKIEAGDLISISSQKNKKVIKSNKPYENNLIGIISTKPSFCGGYLSKKKILKDPKGKKRLIDNSYTDKEMHKLNYRKLALVGQVPAKVCLEGGIIHKGDPLTSSSLPGYAMKAINSGPIVGKALEDFDGSHGKTGKILVFCNLSFYYPEGEIEKLKTENKELKSQLSDINIRLEKLEKLINK